MDRLTEEEILALVDRHFLDRLTAIDNLIAENILVNKQLISLLSGAPTKIEVKPSTLTDQLLQKLVKLEEEKAVRRDKVIYFTYPIKGGTKSIDAGTTTIDFYTGKVTLPDGSEEHLATSLEQHNREYVSSVFVIPSKDIIVWLDDGSKETIKANDYWLRQFQAFKRLYITTTESTDIRIRASTSPQEGFGAVKELVLLEKINTLDLLESITRLKESGPNSVRYGADFSNKHWTGGAMLPADSYGEFAYDIPPDGEQWYISSIAQSTTEATDEHRIYLYMKDTGWIWFDSYYFRQAQWLFPDKFMISAGQEVIIRVYNRSSNPGYFLTHIGAMVIKV